MSEELSREELLELCKKLLKTLKAEHGPRGRHSGVMGDVGCCDWGSQCKVGKFIQQIEELLI